MTTTTLPYDCDAGYLNWQCGWSAGKKDWCCKNRQKGCPQPDPYDCDAGFDNWELGWSFGKKAWCCLHGGGRGCDPEPTPSPGFDCLAGLDAWQTQWAQEKRDWCCMHEDRACYHCDEGLDKWHDGWAVGKKDWCCRHFDKGCEEELHSKDCSPESLVELPVGVSAEGKREWCCRHQDLLCNVELTKPPPFDCDEDFDKWPTAWTDGKKAWCCLHGGRGCDKDDPSKSCWNWVKRDPGMPDVPQPPMTTSAPARAPGYCLMWGDPHIETFDHSFVNFYGEGEFWIVKTQDIKIQARYKATPFTNGLAATQEIIVGGSFIGQHTLSVGPMEGGQILWDRQPVLGSFPSEYDTGCCGKVSYNSVGELVDTAQSHLPKHIVHMELPMNVHVQVMRWSNHINVRIQMEPQALQDGHCGNYNENALDDTTELIHARMGARVPQQELLFNSQTPIDKNRKPLTLADCPADKLNRAKGTCLAQRPESKGVFLDDCAFDVCFGGKQYAEEDGLTNGESVGVVPPPPPGGPPPPGAQAAV